jgi:hypothetical protein
MKRRELLKTACTAAAGLALSSPLRVAAQVNPYAQRDARLFAIAREQLARLGNQIWRKDIVGIADFGVHSASKRFHFVDLENQRVESFHVTHGDGSDGDHDGWLNRYSNIEGSHCSSRGAYMTRSWYFGRFGTSIRLDGLDPTNSLALPRAIVMHKANYATPEHVQRWGKLGRSNGCFAMGPKQFDNALLKLGGGRLLFAESIGLQDDGSVIAPPVAQTDLVESANGRAELLRPENEKTFAQTNPGVF